MKSQQNLGETTMSIKFLSLFLILTISLCAQIRSADGTIAQFQEDRDMLAVVRILDEYRSVLTYESMGYEEGTTKEYLLNPNYTTKVLRVDDKTVGFINYTVIELQFLLKGLIHLIGVDSTHQSQGYGKMLLTHALQELKGKDLSTAILSVKSENDRAQKFYEKEGFKYAARLNRTDLLYEKDL